jgi:hypothetical protein
MPHITRAPIVVLLLSLAFASPAAARRPSAAHRLAELRAALHRYDLAPEGTPRVIEALGELAREAPRRKATEARFLRAIAAGDLALIARLRHDTAALERVAAVFGTSSAGFDDALRTELEALRREPYLSTVDDALAALAPSHPPVLPPADGEHTRQQAVFFTRVFAELMRLGDPTRFLAQLAEDPCGAQAECPSPYDHFGPRGRRAVAAMTALHTLLRSIERTAELGDPFSAALAREVLVDAVVLRSITLAPRDWAPSVQPVASLERGTPIDVDAAIVVSRDRVRAGWAPEDFWDPQGRVSLGADGPLLGSADEVSVAFDGAPEDFGRPLPELAAHVAAGVRGAARIALMVEPGAEAHLVSRVIVSLETADIRPQLLAVAAADGTARGVAFQTVQDDAGPVGVFVRLGGFSAWQRGHHVSLPRRKVDESWEFDFDGLDLATRERVRRPVTLRFMGTVAADVVLRAALRLATVDRPLRLVIPNAQPEG